MAGSQRARFMVGISKRLSVGLPGFSGKQKLRPGEVNP
jgi:hypothetical protein